MTKFHDQQMLVAAEAVFDYLLSERGQAEMRKAAAENKALADKLRKMLEISPGNPLTPCYRKALLRIKAVKDVGADFRDAEGKWRNDAAAERDLMYQHAIEALGLPPEISSDYDSNENGPALFGAASGVERAIPLFVRAHVEVRSNCASTLERDDTHHKSLTQDSALSGSLMTGEHKVTRS